MIANAEATNPKYPVLMADMFHIPNLLTLFRSISGPLIALLLYGGEVAGMVALAVYVGACLSDFLDGWLARRWDQVSDFGRMLDPIADKLLVAAVLVALVDLDVLPDLHIIPVIIILCRELLVSGMREYLAGDLVINVTWAAKWKTTIQMVAIGFLIGGEFGPVAGIGITLMWISALLTAYTGYVYMKTGVGHMMVRDGKRAVEETS